MKGGSLEVSGNVDSLGPPRGMAPHLPSAKPQSQSQGCPLAWNQDGLLLSDLGTVVRHGRLDLQARAVLLAGRDGPDLPVCGPPVGRTRCMACFFSMYYFILLAP